MDRQSKWIEVAENFRKKEDEMKIKDNMYARCLPRNRMMIVIAMVIIFVIMISKYLHLSIATHLHDISLSLSIFSIHLPSLHFHSLLLSPSVLPTFLSFLSPPPPPPPPLPSLTLCPCNSHSIRIKTLENENGIFKKQNSDLKEKSQKLESSYLLLKDECIANVAASNSNEQKLKKMSQENDELVRSLGDSVILLLVQVDLNPIHRLSGPPS